MEFEFVLVEIKKNIGKSKDINLFYSSCGSSWICFLEILNDCDACDSCDDLEIWSGDVFLWSGCDVAVGFCCGGVHAHGPDHVSVKDSGVSEICSSFSVSGCVCSEEMASGVADRCHDNPACGVQESPLSRAFLHLHPPLHCSPLHLDLLPGQISVHRAVLPLPGPAFSEVEGG